MLLHFFPKSEEFNERSVVLIRNGRLVREGVKFYEGRVYYSSGKFYIRNFQERDTTVLLLTGPNDAPQKYSIEAAKD
ncbi:unnamed protein product [Litomosoides sigmodontis]|uniref:Uncharacterized protein n=1 Tax=Litomosoides sigmodontis TaxID=42156 RepID=A0A3P7LZL3_LITSI|nr:unnamed protein product [Litomosoides sigmodontis]